MSVVQLMSPDYANSSYISHFPGIEDRAAPAPVIQTPSPIESSKPETAGGKPAPAKKVAAAKAPSARPNITGLRGKKKL
jgi:hypothetical protein